MFTIQVDKTFYQFIKMFYQSGIWQSDDESKFLKLSKKLFYTFFSASLPIFFATNAILCADRNESICSTQMGVIAAVLYVKLLYLLFKKQEILAFLFDQVVVHNIGIREEYEQKSKTIKNFVRFARLYGILFFISSVFVIFSPLLTFSADKALPFLVTFSWNDSEIVYWLAFVFVSVSSFFFATVNLITPLIWYIMLNYSIEYELLGNQLKRLGVGKKSAYAEELTRLIKAHRNLKETVDRFRSCFSTLFLVQYTTCGIIICASVYNLAFASNKNIFQTELYVALLLYGMFNIFMVMHLANEITLASDRLSYSLFESNWIEQSESCKKYVLIMGEVLKQPQQLVILIYSMNLKTFMTVINGTYRMFNILKKFQ